MIIVHVGFIGLCLIFIFTQIRSEETSFPVFLLLQTQVVWHKDQNILMIRFQGIRILIYSTLALKLTPSDYSRWVSFLSI